MRVPCRMPRPHRALRRLLCVFQLRGARRSGSVSACILWVTCAAAFVLSGRGAGAQAGDGAAQSGAVNEGPTFERDVRPILKAYCFHCHGEEGAPKGGLDLRLRRLMVRGGESGPAIEPGDPDNSYLVARIESGEMPPGDDVQLTAEQVAVIRRWIAAGAPTRYPEPQSIGTGLLITEEDRQFWSFQPVRRPPLPEVRRSGACRNPIDRFVLRRLEQNGFSFAPEADRRTLLRRLCFDLLGLPPSPEQFEAFMQDRRPDAYERLVDRLLASPHYGERWGRHWLDVAGYADSEGYTPEDVPRKWAWMYRDYVIRSFNADKPFDQFIREQLAGDEMIRSPLNDLTPEDVEKLIATGFLRMAPDGTGQSGVDETAARNQVVADTIDIVSSALLGLTVRCAQCHHHRYDPIAQEDYYRFRAVFEPALNWKAWKTPAQRLVSLYTDHDRQQAAQIEKQAAAIDKQRLQKQEEFIRRTFERQLARVPEAERKAVREAYETPANKRTAEQKAVLKKYPFTNVTAGSLYLYDSKAAAELKKLAAEAARIRAQKPKEEFVRALLEPHADPPPTFVFHRGDPEQPRQQVEPAELALVGFSGHEPRLTPAVTTRPSSGRRLALAHSLTEGTHPLVGRVIVNRLWLHHFGRGLVDTPDDFGFLGERPTHPQLLDWLADELVRSGWSIKHIHRLILTSATFRQALRVDARADRIDPENRLFGGARLRRLDAEAFRDSVLFVSGAFNDTPFGPPIPVMADRVGQFVIGIENLNAGRPGPTIPMKGEEFRRSVYVQVRRSRPLAVLHAFDFPPMDPNCARRTESTVSTQSLLLMNNEFLIDQAGLFAARVMAQAGADRRRQVELAWRRALARRPTDQELTQALRFLEEQTRLLSGRVPTPEKKPPSRGLPELEATPEAWALASLCQMLLSSNEFLYID